MQCYFDITYDGTVVVFLVRSYCRARSRSSLVYDLAGSFAGGCKDSLLLVLKYDIRHGGL